MAWANRTRLALGLDSCRVDAWGSARPHEAIRSYSRSPPSGNQVDGSPLDRHAETVAKPGRLGPAQNEKPPQNFFELSRF